MTDAETDHTERDKSIARGLVSLFAGVLTLHVAVAYGSVTIPFDRLWLVGALLVGLFAFVLLPDDTRRIDDGVLSYAAGVGLLTVLVVGTKVGFLGFTMPDRMLVFFESLFVGGGFLAVLRLD